MMSESAVSALTISAAAQAALPTYVLITPARNEEASIEKTIQSVISQTVKPRKWVIVSDGSTDRTDEIIKRYLPVHPWLELVRTPERKERHFAGKVMAFNAGYEKVRHLDYDIIGSLDADISFDTEYIGFLLSKFVQFHELGVAGTPFREGNAQYDYRFSRKEHVSGACQLFRRKCFEEIGGYIPIKEGAIDLTAVVTARMKGWRTQTFTEKHCVHHRTMGTAKNNVYRALFISGYGDYRMGVHPLWQLCRSTYQMSRKPLLLGGSILLIGYLWALAKRAPKPVSKEFVDFRGREQMKWLKEYLMKVFKPSKSIGQATNFY
jgi:poly-beta-1,6-N-acetyl-D-glucosamine synthase